MRVIAGTPEGAASQAADVGWLAADVRQAARDAVQHSRAADRWARFLDGYAGTGAVGIEALSRGAKAVTFIESDRRAETLIAENLAHCGVENGYAIIRATVERAIDQLDAAAFGPTNCSTSSGSIRRTSEPSRRGDRRRRQADRARRDAGARACTPPGGAGQRWAPRAGAASGERRLDARRFSS